MKSFFCFATLSILFFAGCGRPGESSQPAGGGGPADSSGGDLIDPCSLLTQAEATEIMGVAAEAGEFIDTGNVMGVRICQWSVSGENEPGLVQISLVQTEAMGEAVRARGMTAETLFHDTRTALEGAQKVEGVGDDAYWNGGDLTFLKNGVQVSVSAGSRIIVQNGEQGLPAAKKVAAKVEGRL